MSRSNRNKVFRNLNDEAHLSVANRLKKGDQLSSVDELSELYSRELDRIFKKKLRSRILEISEELSENTINSKQGGSDAS